MAGMLKDKTALVTGGGTGIGRCVAIALARAGARVIVAGRTPETVERVARETGGRAIRLDVTDPRSVEAAVREAGRVDVLVNNAAAFANADVVDTTPEDWSRVLQTNLTGVFLMSRAVLPQMIERRSGDIVMICSTSGKRANPSSSAYGASKHGLTGFAHALLQEVRKHSIRVITVSPSAVELPERGPMRENRLQAPDIADAVVAALSLPRRALVRDIELWATNP
jgi:3-oxoacyl-[acyl-carrier protein] reductase